MDKKQTFIFNTFSTVINFKKLFKELTKIYHFENYEEDEYNKIFETLKFKKESPKKIAYKENKAVANGCGIRGYYVDFENLEIYIKNENYLQPIHYSVPC